MKTRIASVEPALSDLRMLGGSLYPRLRVFIGTYAQSISTLAEVANGKSHGVLHITGNDFPLKLWLLEIEQRQGLSEKILSQLATRVGCAAQEFKLQWYRKTSRDRENFWAALTFEKHDPSFARILHALEKPDELPELAWDASLIQAVVDILPLATPWLCFTVTDYEQLLEHAKTLVGWVEAIPKLNIALVVTPSIWQEYIDRAPASRTKAILREGTQELLVTDAAVAAESLGKKLGKPVPLSEVLPDGIDAPLLEAVEALAEATSHCPQSEEENDLARSQAERTLFEFLERWPETAGLFAQNAQLDFQFGPRSAEIDLFCREARVAVEIDGYFHFKSDDAYRRDRAKDWELQRRGYLVLRFLANDILPRIDEIRDRIFAALAVASRSLPQ